MVKMFFIAKNILFLSLPHPPPAKKKPKQHKSIVKYSSVLHSCSIRHARSNTLKWSSLAYSHSYAALLIHYTIHRINSWIILNIQTSITQNISIRYLKISKKSKLRHDIFVLLYVFSHGQSFNCVILTAILFFLLCLLFLCLT